MKYCTRCGTANDDNALYCKQCGNPFVAPQPSAPPNASPPPGPAQQGYPPPYGSPQAMQYSEFQNANMMILIAFIFSVISILIFVVEALLSIFALLRLIIFLVFAIFSILVFLKTWKIYQLTTQARYQEAYQEDTDVWGVLGIIFGLVITGVFLLLARMYLENGLRPHGPY